MFDGILKLLLEIFLCEMHFMQLSLCRNAWLISLCLILLGNKFQKCKKRKRKKN